jgi:DNA-binding Lrp family transcriptional regulator
MRDLDETDLEILQLLMRDARTPWSDIAEVVDLSPPAVSDRVARLREVGVVRRFTVDLDRSQLREGVPVLVDIAVAPGDLDPVREALAEADAVEHAFTTASGHLVVQAGVPDGDVREWLFRVVDPDAVAEYEVTLLTDVEWTPSLGGTEFALTCAECGNTVTSEGVAARVGDDLHQFCCPSCRERFEERYEELEADAD